MGLEVRNVEGQAAGKRRRGRPPKQGMPLRPFRDVLPRGVELDRLRREMALETLAEVFGPVCRDHEEGRRAADLLRELALRLEQAYKGAGI